MHAPRLHREVERFRERVGLPVPRRALRPVVPAPRQSPRRSPLTTAAHARRRGGFSGLPRESALDRFAARSALNKGEFIFDVQGHFVNPPGAWTRRLAPNATPPQMPKTKSCGPSKGPGHLDYLQCIGADEFVKDVFMDSATY